MCRIKFHKRCLKLDKFQIAARTTQNRCQQRKLDVDFYSSTIDAINC